MNVVLYTNLGKKEYQHLKSYFKIPRINTSSYEDITASFSEVFKSVPLTSYEVINDNIRKKNIQKLNINTDFDFEFLIESTPTNIDKNKVLISPEAIVPIQNLKTEYLGSVNPRLHSNEILIALSVSALHSEDAKKALAMLPKLKGMQAHVTCDVADVDLSIYSNLGIMLTYDANKK